MKLVKADNYQTWYIENNNESVIIDPWLTKTLNAKNPFFIQRTKEFETCLESDQFKKIKAIILTAPFEDHLNIESIRFFPTNTPIYTSNIVSKFLKYKEMPNPIHILKESGTQICNMQVSSFPTSYPYYSSTFSILFESNNKRIFHEGHIVNFKYIEERKIKADVAILTADQVKLFGLITLGMDTSKAIKACELLESDTLFITGNNPEETKGLIGKFLTIKRFNPKELSKCIRFYDGIGDNIELN